MRITASGQTDVGRQRDHNEDASLIDPDLGLYIGSGAKVTLCL